MQARVKNLYRRIGKVARISRGIYENLKEFHEKLVLYLTEIVTVFSLIEVTTTIFFSDNFAPIMKVNLIAFMIIFVEANL